MNIFCSKIRGPHMDKKNMMCMENKNCCTYATYKSGFFHCFTVGSMEMPSLNRSMAPLQEYLLQGSILDKHRAPFLHRLNGLCDVISAIPEKFHDHEMVYHLSKCCGLGLQWTRFDVIEQCSRKYSTVPSQSMQQTHHNRALFSFSMRCR